MLLAADTRAASLSNMCGIAGIAALAGAPKPELPRLVAQGNTLVHRGPDAEGVELYDGVGLVTRRLAIIDPQGGVQPMGNEDRTVRVVFNGEIYNFRELRAELESLGHRFATRSDTEVIVHGYEQWGASGCVERLNGMFAFALYDQRRRRLVLARDHLGIKPLFYAYVPPYLVWGSEIKAVLASGLVPLDLDIDALGQFIAWEYVPGEATLVRSIRKLRPGKLIVMDIGDDVPPVPCRYWDVPDCGEDGGKSEAVWVETVDATLARCVKRQLVSDVPLGAFLSGGVDSSLVTAGMGRGASAFSIGFEDASYDELPWARQVARHLGVAHFETEISPRIAELFPRLIHHLDDPIADSSVFSTYLVARFAREHVTVALSGDGGDELFGGYETYVAQQAAGLYERLPRGVRGTIIEPIIRSLAPRPQKKGLVNKAKRFLEGLQHSPALGHTRWRLFMGEMRLRALLTPQAQEVLTTPVEAHIVELAERAGHRQPLNRALYIDLKSYLCDEMLVKVDRMTMATSLEARVPMLDRELVELAFRIPDRFKLDGWRTKPLLKAVAKRHVPAECVERQKEGFSVPIKQWLGSSLAPTLHELLDPARLKAEGLFDVATVERMKREHLAGIANHSHSLWALIVFEAWRDRWLDRSAREAYAA